jgi:hypothetical protein
MSRRGLVAALVIAGALSGTPGPALGAPPVAAVGAAPRYSHAEHAKLRLPQQDCAGCHTLDAKLIPLPPLTGKDHAPCNASGCHRADFFSRTPKVCGACHDSYLPWAASPSDLSKRPKRGSEFGSDFSHKAHIGAKLQGAASPNATCRHCHADPDGPRGSARPDHAICATCHNAGIAPAMASCGGCHLLRTSPNALATSRASAAPGVSPWAVDEAFRHERHRKDPRPEGANAARETPCTVCHTAAPTSTSARGIRPPTMASCEACHDGTVAFKTTGFACGRCHGPASSRPSRAPAEAQRPALTP